MEAVKKLQNSNKLLQKVIYPWRVARVWALPGKGSPDSAPPPNWMCSMLVGSDWGGEGWRDGILSGYPFPTCQLSYGILFRTT